MSADTTSSTDASRPVFGPESLQEIELRRVNRIREVEERDGTILTPREGWDNDLRFPELIEHSTGTGIPTLIINSILSNPVKKGRHLDCSGSGRDTTSTIYWNPINTPSKHNYTNLWMFRDVVKQNLDELTKERFIPLEGLDIQSNSPDIITDTLTDHWKNTVKKRSLLVLKGFTEVNPATKDTFHIDFEKQDIEYDCSDERPFR